LPAEPSYKIDDPRYVKALAHPLRIRILAMLGERPASPVQIAQRVDATLGAVAYHVRTLHNLGLIELVETRQRRGATEHVYQAIDVPRFTDEAWGQLGPVAKQRMLSAMLRQIGDFVNGSAAAGGFDHPEANITRLSMTLDKEGWDELAEAQKRWVAEAEDIEKRSRKRTRRIPDHELLHTGLVLLFFEAIALSDHPPPRGGTARGHRRRSGSAELEHA
jgi:DNA-binding transcriptional ArsR family regulator